MCNIVVGGLCTAVAMKYRSNRSFVFAAYGLPFIPPTGKSTDSRLSYRCGGCRGAGRSPIQIRMAARMTVSVGSMVQLLRGGSMAARRAAAMLGGGRGTAPGMVTRSMEGVPARDWARRKRLGERGGRR